MRKLLVLLLIFNHLSVNAESVEINGIRYNLITKGNSAVVEGISSDFSGDFTLPEKVVYEDKEYYVTSITNISNENITSLTIPEGVTAIGQYGINCPKMTSVFLPSTLNELGYRAFWGNYNLNSVYIASIESWNEVHCQLESNPLLTASHLFLNNEEIIDLIIPETVGVVKGAFAGFKGIKSVTTTNSYSIQESAFANCTGLTKVTLSNSVSSIKSGAFDGCTNLESVILGSGVKQIYSGAFGKCEKLTDVYCYAQEVPSTDKNAFKDSYISFIKLYVPSISIDKYKNTEPWKEFKEIVSISGEEIPTCEKPMISYENGHLSFSCATEGVKFVSSITNEDIKNYYTESITLSATYNISVYTTKSGYNNSDVVTATLCWVDVEPKAEGLSDVSQVKANAVMIKTTQGQICIEGADDNTGIAVYNLDGVQVGSATSRNGVALVNTNMTCNSMAIVKIGNRSIKVAMK